MPTDRSFPIPGEMPDIPGTEGWREMYPAHMVFSNTNRKQIEYERSRFWFQESLHVPFALSPLDCYSHDMWRLTLSQSNNRTYLVPSSRGIDHRILNGYLYITAHPVEDPGEGERRAELFHKRAGHYYQNWPEIFERWSGRMEKIVADMESIQFVDLPDTEPESTITDGLGYGKSYPLLRDYHRFWDVIYLSWQYHFELLNLAYGADAVFIGLMQNLFPDASQRVVGQLLAGFDSKLFRPPEKLQELARKALDWGLCEQISACSHWDEVPLRIESTVEGRQWLKAFEDARYPWFEMSCGIGWYHHEPTWNQNLDVPLNNIKRYMETLKLGKPITRPREEVLRERDRVVTEYRSLIVSESDRNAFDQLHGIAVTLAPYAEDHMWYCSNYEHAIFFRKMRDLGRIFCNHGIIEDKEDIFYFNRYEIPEVLYDLCSGWAIGTPPTSSYYWPEKIARRKEILSIFREWKAPPALGPAPDSMTEPFAIAFWGITTETINNWLAAKEVKPGEIDKLNGFPASSGVKRGRARVCRTIDDISELKVGEILVASTTSPTWAAAFQSINGCVTDFGGTCCHAAIVSREYGMPAVVGTGYATRVINTGDLIEIDGDNGVVNILNRV